MKRISELIQTLSSIIYMLLESPMCVGNINVWVHYSLDWSEPFVGWVAASGISLPAFKNKGFLGKRLITGLSQIIYKMNMEYLLLSESKYFLLKQKKS